MSRAVMQQALDALEQLDGLDTDTKCVTIYVSKEIEALRAELAKPEPEHVAWTYESIFERPSFVNGSSGFIWNNSHASDMIPLYRKEDL